MKLFLLKKKLTILLGRKILLFFYRKIANLLKVFFRRKTFMIVTGRGIKSYTLGYFAQATIIVIMIWMFGLFNIAVNNDKILSKKDEEIERLKAHNSYYNKEFEDVNKKLEKVNKYFLSISGGIKNVNQIEHIQENNNFDKKNDLSKEDSETMSYIQNSTQTIEEIEYSVVDRLQKIEKALSKTGLVLKGVDKKREISTRTSQESSKNMGGPFGDISEIDKILIKKNSQKHVSRHNFSFESNFEYLIKLEKLISVMPLARPMRGYFLSSGFGIRKDPITGRRHAHHGLDFVGAKNEKIISPSSGKVILANWFSDYGNAIVIDHGNGFTTRYGHLSALNVREGQNVKKGQVIARQGSTGRSTGPHLHYEIRYKNKPLDPKNFIGAGDMLNRNGSNGTRYVKS